jgi:hypothetical protein
MAGNNGERGTRSTLFCTDIQWLELLSCWNLLCDLVVSQDESPRCHGFDLYLDQTRSPSMDVNDWLFLTSLNPILHFTHDTTKDADSGELLTPYNAVALPYTRQPPESLVHPISMMVD